MEASYFLIMFGDRLHDFMVKEGVSDVERTKVCAVLRKARDLVSAPCSAWDADYAVLLLMKAFADATLAVANVEDSHEQ